MFSSWDTRNRGSLVSYDEQIKAAHSHANFIKSIQNIEVKVYISSYSTNFNYDLIKVYSDYLIGFNFYDNLIRVTNLIRNTTNNISNIKDFDFILFIEIFNSNINNRRLKCKKM